ncbi:endopeptidase La [Flexistipes sinusarabici]|uniref:endopeptidase La n=1 Tax=Flexistipes sinusarabici TaxID=2352 RepID=UPI00235690D6|nr:endopeptidase La [Flexistipes sinusarabici]
MADKTEQFSLIPLRDIVIFPTMVTPVFVGRKKSINALDVAGDTDKKIFLVLQKDSGVNDPGIEDLYNVGVVADILQVLKLPDGSIKVLVEGAYRAEIKDLFVEEECTYVNVKPFEDKNEDETFYKYLRESLMQHFKEFAQTENKIPKEIYDSIVKMDDLNNLSYMIASNLSIRVSEQQEILEIASLSERIEKIIEFIEMETEIKKIDKKIKQRVKSQMTKTQREYYLNEQIKAINKELGRDEDIKADIEELQTAINEKKMPKIVREKAEKELKKLRIMPPMSAETTVVRNYLDWIVSLPWGEYTEDILDLEKAEDILNRDHYGLEKPKERILEFLAVKKFSERIKGPILCFVGPPGVGKTSLAKSIAESMNRNFVRLSLGGVRDEAEIRGHRRTYIGSMPGKIIQSVRRAESMNPVFLLDEIDKLGMDFRGDPSSALLEALDPEQNNSFSDHYLEVDFDLSKVFFITTANTVESIPHALLDRMEVIRIPGYTEREKLNIAEKYLFPKQLSEHNIPAEKVDIAENAILDVIRYYTKEAGVRNLERELASVIRKAAKKLVTENNVTSVKVTRKNLENLLGVKRFRLEHVEESEDVGVATGLAWTPYGGDILQTEVAAYEGNGQLQITGHIGDVMQESARTALSVVKSRARRFQVPAYKFKDFDIHLHVPEGAVPKDGPSAGITMATAILSALSGIYVDCNVAMSGEINLRGKVLPVGGIKEKVLAAHRAGVKKVILPEDNRKDLTEVPSDVKKQISVVFAKTIDDVFDIVLKTKTKEMG